MNILVFKTNLQYRKNAKDVMPHLNELPGIVKWNIDFHDRDRVLRVETKDHSPQEIAVAVRKAGFDCEELPD